MVSRKEIEIFPETNALIFPSVFSFSISCCEHLETYVYIYESIIPRDITTIVSFAFV